MNTVDTLKQLRYGLRNLKTDADRRGDKYTAGYLGEMLKDVRRLIDEHQGSLIGRTRFVVPTPLERPDEE